MDQKHEIFLNSAFIAFVIFYVGLIVFLRVLFKNMLFVRLNTLLKSFHRLFFTLHSKMIENKYFLL